MATTRPLRVTLLSAALAGAAQAAPEAAPNAAPAAGRYDGQLCVATEAGRAPGCGPARVELHSARLATVRVSDMQYVVALRSSQADVVLKHGAMQIDAFVATYEWRAGDARGSQRRTLHFTDADKGVRYEVQLGDRRP